MSIDNMFPFATSAQPTVVTDTRRSRNRNVTSSVPWTMTRIDAMPGKRNNFICVMVDNPKQPTGRDGMPSIAWSNWPLYGKLGVPSVTVADFIKSYPARDGGVTRAERSLTWDLDRGLIRIVMLTDPDAPKFEPVTTSPLAALVATAAKQIPASIEKQVSFGSRIEGGNPKK